MYSGHYYDLCVKKLFKQYSEYNTNWLKNSRFFEVKKKDNCVNNSDSFFLDFWRINEILPYCKTDIKKTIEENQKIQQITIVDDFAGTGKTIKDYLTKVLEEYPDLRKKEIVILLLACTNLAEQALLDFSCSAKLQLHIIYEKKYDKVFVANSITTQEEVEENKRNYLSICNEYGLEWALGRDATEALIAFYYNTPNNTLGIFWEEIKSEDGVSFKGLRPRKRYNRIRPQSGKVKRVRQGLFNNKEYTESYNYILFSYMCIYSKKRFNKSQITTALGLTNRQFFVRLDFCLLKGYIKNENGKFVEGDRLKQLGITVSVKATIRSEVQRLLGIKDFVNDGSQPDKGFIIDSNYICKGF